MQWPKALGFAMAGAMVVLLGCVSSGTLTDEMRRSEERERSNEVRLNEALERQKVELAKINSLLDECRTKLKDPAVQSVLEINARLEACQKQIKEVERRAYADGKLAVWESLSISATPSTEGIVFKDYFLTIDVRVRNRSVYHFRIPTEGPQNGFVTTLSAAASAATIASILRGL